MDQQPISKQLGPFRRKFLPQQGIFDAFAAHHFPVGQAPLENFGPHPRTVQRLLWELTDDHPPLGHRTDSMFKLQQKPAVGWLEDA